MAAVFYGENEKQKRRKSAAIQTVTACYTSPPDDVVIAARKTKCESGKGIAALQRIT
jgi:hypothetical protein